MVVYGGLFCMPAPTRMRVPAGLLNSTSIDEEQLRGRNWNLLHSVIDVVVLNKVYNSAINECHDPKFSF